MTLLEALAGAGLGAIGSVVHLAVVRWRAGLCLRGGAGAVLATGPLGLAGPAAAVILAARIGPAAAWCAPLGILALRGIVLRRCGGGP